MLTDTVTFEIFAAYSAELASRIRLINKRLAKADLPPVEFTTWEADPDKKGRAMIGVELQRVLPHYNGYRLVSILEFFEGQTLIRTAPGQDTPAEFRPADPQRCDHCHTRHLRTKVYIVSGPEGFAQIGSTCLHKYLPTAAARLISAEWLLDELTDVVNEGSDEGFYFRAGRDSYDMKFVLELSLRAIANSGWVSSKMSKERGILSTADEVRDFFGSQVRDRAEWKAERPKGSRYTADEVLAYCETMPGETDYAFNIRTLAGMTHIPWNMFGYVASMPAAYIRSLEQQGEKQVAEKKAAPAGRQQVTGKIVSFKEQYSDWGVVDKVLLQCDGWRLYVTLPSSLEGRETATEGDTLTMTVTVEPSRDDPSFAFGKRPTKASLQREATPVTR